MKRIVAALLLAALACTPAFAAMRCGNRIVTEGDTSAEVAAKCGEPVEVIRQPTVLRPPVVWINGRPRYVGEDYIEVNVEEWIYNFGPTRFMRRVRFENGVVEAIETLGYGYL